MPKLSATVRITLGLVGLLTSLLLFAGMLGLYPDIRNSTLQGRRRLCESLAINFSLMADRANTDTMRSSLETVASRNPDILSMAVRRDDGSLLIEIGEHEAHWNLGTNGRSTDTDILVQISSQGKLWGTVETRFQPITTSGLIGILTRSEFIHVFFVASVGLLIFYVYLRIVLRQLNPSTVIPNRVRDALDTLAEGLLVLDRNERIVLANRAFEESTGAQSDGLIGRSIRNLPLISRDESPSDTRPWTEAIQSGSAVTGRLFGMDSADDTERTFSVSASPIIDEKGQQRGALASFEDVTRLEQKKRELNTMVDYLRASSDEIKRQNRELESLATRDPLTGCLNRRSFFEHFEQEWSAAQRYQYSLSAAMVDIDRFKSINDSHGHSVGDDVLRIVATKLLETSRESDIVCRYGGEEFVVLMPHTDLDDAEIGAERLRLAIEGSEFPELSITASLGVSSLSEEPADPQELLDQADKCLYAAKRNGRNQVVRWDNLPDDLEEDEFSDDQDRVGDVPTEQVSVPVHAVTALLSALAYRDQATAAHARRVADLCVATGEGLLSLGDCYSLEIAALLHDIGKLGVPDNILLKPDQLTHEEWDVMRHHERIGVEIIRASFASPKLTAIVGSYRAHYGGNTGPAEIPFGNDIPVGARILAIADAYDSMITDRVYRKGRTREEAFTELRRCAGTQFDAELVERFISTVMMGHTDHPVLDGVSQELALSIGLQLEALSTALDRRDLDALDAMSRRLHSVAEQHGAVEIAEKTAALDSILQSDRDLMSVIQTANELLDLCRSTQSSFLENIDLEQLHLDLEKAECSLPVNA